MEVKVIGLLGHIHLILGRSFSSVLRNLSTLAAH
jgi:hypothetical protein